MWCDVMWCCSWMIPRLWWTPSLRLRRSSARMGEGDLTKYWMTWMNIESNYEIRISTTGTGILCDTASRANIMFDSTMSYHSATTSHNVTPHQSTVTSSGKSRPILVNSKIEKSLPFRGNGLDLCNFWSPDSGRHAQRFCQVWDETDHGK